MKQLEKNDLKVGEIYIAQYKKHNYQGKYIVKINNNMCDCFNIYTNIGILYKNGNFSNVTLDFCEATLEEKHWLKECIEADKFVSYEEAMKTFIPEYVECVGWKSYLNNPSHIEGVVYKILDGGFVELNPKCNLSLPTRYLTHKECFKTSTKEAYEAQFVVKEPEFVLPEIWWVRITKENLEDVCKFLGFEPYERAVDNIAGMCKHYRTGKIEKGWNATPTTVYGSTFGDEITTEQFRKYVLKKEPVVFEEPKDTVLRFQQINKRNNIDICITEVQCSEGGIYKIGDKITVFDKTSPNKGKPFTIKSFRWNNTKTKICAVTELHTPNGIGLDKIELYVEPKIEQELSLLEQAKLKYPVGTKVISSTLKNTHIIKGNIRYGFQNSSVYNYIFGNDGGCTLYNPNTNEWAEIVDDFVLPEKWCIKDVKEVKEFFENYNFGGYTCSNNGYLHYPRIVNHCYFKTIQKDYTEITLEQFKKYVLNEKV